MKWFKRFRRRREKSLREKIIDISNRLQISQGLRQKYIVGANLATKQFWWVSVSEFYLDHIEMTNGELYSYTAFSGYCFPPESIINKIRAQESGILLNTKPLQKAH